MIRIALFFLISSLAIGCSSDPEKALNSDNVGGVDTGESADSGAIVDDTSDAGSDTSDASLGDDLGAADTGRDDAATVDAGVDADEADAQIPAAPIYVGTDDPYANGSLAVGRQEIAAGDGLPKDVLVFWPDEPGTYPLVVFQHGFSLRNSYYSTMLEQLTSHGFVVVAPQMYEPSFDSAPTAAEEAVEAEALYGWATAELDELLPVDVASNVLGLAGHSRGAKVVWLVLEAGFPAAVAAAGLDPVDGTGGPFGGEERVLAGGLTSTVPAHFIGAELSAELTFGMACAPEGDDHLAFYEASGSPAYWTFAEDYGHLDMLDDDTSGCGFFCTVCSEGPDDDNFRRFSAGQLVAFFRMTLQGVAAAESFLTDGATAPVTAQFMNK